MGSIGKITKIVNVMPQSLSGGQIAAIVISPAVVIIGGFAWYAFRKERRDRDDDDDDDKYDSRMGRLLQAITLKMRALRTTQGKEPVPTSEPKQDVDADSNMETAGLVTGGGTTGKQELPWDEKYVPR